MTQAMAYHANDPNVGMSLVMDINRYKMYIGDTELLLILPITKLYKLKIEQFKIAGAAENNSKSKTQNSKLPQATNS